MHASAADNTKTETVKVRDLGSNGEGVAKAKSGQTLFIPEALPEENVKCSYSQTTQKFAKATLVQIETPSPNRVNPPCEYFGTCGGCQLQHLAYPAQLAWKQSHVENQLRRLGNLTINTPISIISDTALGYRNKAIFPLSKKAIGFYKSQSHDIIPVEHCLVNHPKIDEVYSKIRPLLQNSKLSFYNEATHQGLLRHLMLRYSHAEDKVWVTLIINGTKTKTLDTLISTCLDPKLIGGVSVNINTKKGNVILGEETQHLWGRPYFEETLLGLTLTCATNAFLQVNWEIATKLYQHVTDLIPEDPTQTVIDLYTGIGIFALLAASKARQVIGIESVPQAIEAAKENTVKNKITNTQFICASLEKEWLNELPKLKGTLTVIIDPPRKGCSTSVLAGIKTLSPQTVIYISCNPATLARDSKELQTLGYTAKSMTTFDMFAQTTHLETVIIFTK